MQQLKPNYVNGFKVTLKFHKQRMPNIGILYLCCPVY